MDVLNSLKMIRLSANLASNRELASYSIEQGPDPGGTGHPYAVGAMLSQRYPHGES